MSKYHYIQKKLENLKHSAKKIISNETKENESSFFKIDQGSYNKLLKIADAQKSSVEAILSMSVEQYYTRWSAQSQAPVTLERMEENPVLYLDNLSKRYPHDREEFTHEQS
ncbi:MAG: hypothetical protein A2189_02855 [Paenibacillus sp. RIFOXYA1_FULL_44_5]|nr:MAG: hypothetical protein A2189_02855 [Paenibacillus sp. RIFOXYA1_FULL_44_5]